MRHLLHNLTLALLVVFALAVCYGAILLSVEERAARRNPPRNKYP